MKHHTRGSRGPVLGLVAVVAAMALLMMGLQAGATAAPTGGPGEARAISNDLVKIHPAKVKGTYTDPDSGHTGKVVAKFVPEEFIDEGGALAVTGTLSGVFAGKLPQGQERHFSVPVTLPVTGADAVGEATPSSFQNASFQPASSHGCSILHLDLGPLDLNILGLQVDLSQIVLDIVAQPGAGNLLGNLLCAVAGLLDGGGGGLGGLLDGVIAFLNGLLAGLLQLDALLGLLDGVLSGAAATETV
ncbi:hypothetical protein [Nocardioides sp.]|uniref:hypothetical protein n=1 Tax=Nocardioides sp. TaxID=35761 RepID=UPI002736FD11|nr:hypothetical protein [Nocardioides sp.]MDP3893132.1 hypothetical protein [Nocardioides sp.]